MPLTSGDQHIFQHCGPVGHEAIDANVDQPVHLHGVVNGPDMNVEPQSMRTPYELARHDRHASVTDRDLRGGCLETEW